MHRREFLLGAGSLWLAGCAGSGSREWADVPWVAPAPAPPPPPLAVTPAPPRASAGGVSARSGTAHDGDRPAGAGGCACAPPAGPAPGRAPAVRGAAWVLVTREQWGAQCLRANHDPMGAVTRITLHHTDEHPGMRGKSDLEVVRAIQRYHQDGQGWADIGYHYLVGRDGRVYEGRTAGAQGAHSGGANNRNNLGISVIGNFTDAAPPVKQLATLGAFLEDRCAAYGVERVSLLGHRDLRDTECPGDALYGWLQGYRHA